MKRGIVISALAGFVLLAQTLIAQARTDLFCGLATANLCWSMQSLGTKVEQEFKGEQVDVHAHTSAMRVAGEIVRAKPKFIVLGGHSAGCSAAVTAAWHLYRKKIAVDVLLCFDGASAFMDTKTVPPNVKLTVSWRQDGWLGGARLCKGPAAHKRGDTCILMSTSSFIWERTVALDHLTVGVAYHDKALQAIHRGRANVQHAN
jgi:hypothetical protein